MLSNFKAVDQMRAKLHIVGKLDTCIRPFLLIKSHIISVAVKISWLFLDSVMNGSLTKLLINHCSFVIIVAM